MDTDITAALSSKSLVTAGPGGELHRPLLAGGRAVMGGQEAPLRSSYADGHKAEATFLTAGLEVGVESPAHP